MWLRLMMVGLLMVTGLQACKEPYEWHANDITGAMPDLQFNLIGPDEDMISAQSLQGRPVLVFFGFTSCPDVCPTTLAQLKTVVKKLGPQADEVQVLLVSVDPDRDTPAVMKSYTAGFGPWVLGLTGPEADIDALRERYGVYASMESSDERGNYNVMHSPAVFVFDQHGSARLLFTDVSDSDAVASDLRELLSQ